MPDTFHFKFPDRKRMIHIPASFKHSKVSRKKKQRTFNTWSKGASQLEKY